MGCMKRGYLGILLLILILSSLTIIAAPNSSNISVNRGDVVFGEKVLWNLTYTDENGTKTMVYSTPAVYKETKNTFLGDYWIKKIILTTNFSGVYNNIRVTEEVPSIRNLSITPEKNFTLENKTLGFSVFKLNKSATFKITGLYTEENLDITYGEIVQGTVNAGVPVNWNQTILVKNPFLQTAKQHIELNMPYADNISVYLGDKLLSQNHSFDLTLMPQEQAVLKVEFTTEPVRLEVLELDTELMKLLPESASDIQIFDNGVEVASYSQVEEAELLIPKAQKKLVVYHNSTLHYHNISLNVPVTEEEYEKINGTGNFEKINGSVFWNIPRLSGVSATIDPVKIQGNAKVGSPVNWTMFVGNYTVYYKTPAPQKQESETTTGKRIVVSSDASDHYHNISVTVAIPETKIRPKLYHIENQTRQDVTYDPKFDLRYLVDENNTVRGMKWTVPRLSEDVYEIDISTLQVLSRINHSEWYVGIDTQGTANLSITSNSTISLDNQSDLRFLGLWCSNKSVNFSYVNNSIFVYNYSCNSAVMLLDVFTSGLHQLRILFGDGEKQVSASLNQTITIQKKHENLDLLPGQEFCVERTISGPAGTDVDVVPLYSGGVTLRKIAEKGAKLKQSSAKLSLDKENKVAGLKSRLPQDLQKMQALGHTQVRLNSNRTVEFCFKAPTWEQIRSGHPKSGRISYLAFSGDNLDYEESTWWNVSWEYRHEINVSSTSELSDFQVELTLTNSTFNFSQASDNLSDIRITYYNSSEDTETVVPYWIESNHSMNYSAGEYNATFWFRAPHLQAGNTTFYVYHGSSASSASNGTATFLFFDDFENETEFNNTWTFPINSGTDAAFSVSNGYLEISGGATPNLAVAPSVGLDDYVTDFEFYFVGSLGGAGGGVVRYDNQTDEWYEQELDEDEINMYYFSDVTGTDYDRLTGSNYATSADTWFDITHRINGTDISATVGDTTVTASDSRISSGVPGVYRWNRDCRFDDYRVRRFADPEPTIAFGKSEERFGSLNSTIEEPVESSTKIKEQAFTMNGTVECAGGDCYNVQVNAQYLSTATPLQTWTETTSSDFQSKTSSTNVSVSNNLRLAADNSDTSWWNTSWNYRQTFNFTNTAGNLSNHQVRLVLNSSIVGSSFNWTDDENAVRFVWYNESSGQHIRAYHWLYDWDTSNENATVWIEFPFIENNANTTLHMYYGNPSADPGSDGKNTFLFFDDFSDSSYSSANWDQYYDNSGSWSVTGGYAEFDSSNQGAISLAPSVGLNDYIVEAKTMHVSSTGPAMGLVVRASSNGNYYHQEIDENSLDMYRFDTWTPSQLGSTGVSVSADTWYEVLYRVNGTTLYAESLSHGASLLRTDTNFASGNPGVEVYSQTARFDDFRVRKFAPTQPEYTSSGTEEQLNLVGSGQYISGIKDFGSSDVELENITWSESTNENTSIEVWTRSSQGSVTGWWNSNWEYRKAINISNSGSELTDHQVKIETNITDLYNESKIKQDCGDIRFVAYSGTWSEADYWVEHCNITGDNSTFWVKVPTIDSSDNTTVYMYYGNSAVNSTSNATNVFERVISEVNASWMFDEGSGDIAYDTAGSGYHGNISGDTTWVDGRYGKALYFDGTSDYVQILHKSYTGTISEITVCAWVNSSSSQQQFILSYDRSEYFRLALKDDAGSNNVGWDTDGQDLRTTTDYTDGNWHFVCGWLDTGESPSKKIIIDGIVVNESSDGAATGSDLRYGFIGTGSEANVSDPLDMRPEDWMLGIIDEVFIFDKGLTVPTTNCTAQPNNELCDIYNNHGYTTPAYPNNMLVRKYADPELSSIVNGEVNYSSYSSQSENFVWSAWFIETNSQPIESPDNRRYLQYKIQLNSTNNKQTPVLSDISVGYRMTADTWSDVESSGKAFTASNPYDCGHLNETNNICNPEWSITPKTVGNYSLRYCANSSSGTVETECSEVRNVSVWRQPSITDMTSSVDPVGQGDTTTLQARLTNDLGQGMSGNTLNFIDLNGSTWYDNDWQYRKQVDVGGTELEDYQIKLNINLSDEYNAGKIQSGCEDIRFTIYNETINSEQLIPHWTENCTLPSANATLWARVPNITAANSTIYMYYGNPTAQNASDMDSAMGNFEFGNLSVTTSWTTVNLANTYADPVIVTTYNLPDISDTATVVRITNITNASFNARLQEVDGSSSTTSQVHYIVMERGKWHLPDGTPVEAQKFLSTDTSNTGLWTNPEPMSYLHNYSLPVVLGQVMSYNDENWSVFWSCSGSYLEPANSTDLFVGKHVANDPDTSREDEQLGVIMLENGSEGNIAGISYEAKIGTDMVEGTGNSPPYNYSLGFSSETAVAVQAAMDGTDGGWAVLYSPDPFADSKLGLAIDEYNDRAHINESVYYIAFSEAGSLPLRKNTTEEPTIHVVGEQSYSSSGTVYTVGNATTTGQGYAAIDYLLASNTVSGLHTINVSYPGDVDQYILPVSDTYTITVASIPDIDDLIADPSLFGFGYNTTIRANVTNEVGSLDTVRITLTYPNSTTIETDMTPGAGDEYTYPVNGQWQTGTYSYYVWANNSYDVEKQSEEQSFDIEAYLNLTIMTQKQQYQNYEYVYLGSEFYYPSLLYRKPINISSDDNYTNYELELEFDSADIEFSRTTEDGSDLRFSYLNNTDSEEYPLDYWVEEWNTSTEEGTVWVKVPYLEDEQTLYVYYGNSTGIESESNGSQVFAFFDDFEGASIDTGKWDTSNVGSASYDINSSLLRMWDSWGGACHADSMYANYLRTVQSFSAPLVVESRFRPGPSNALTSCRICYNTVFNDNEVAQIDSGSYAFTFRVDDDNDYYVYGSVDTGDYPTAGVFQKSTKIFTNTSMNITTDFVSQHYNHTGQGSNSGTIGILGDADQSTADEGTHVDWIFVRNFTDNSPVIEFGERENLEGLTNDGSTDILGYLYMRIEEYNGGWSGKGAPIVDQEFVSLSSGNYHNVSANWNDNGGWYTSEWDPGRYRVYAALYGPDYLPLNDSTGSAIRAYYEFNISKSVMSLYNLSHNNYVEHSIDEYETTDSIDWINVSVKSSSNRALDSNTSLNLLYGGQSVGWGPNSKKSCGDLLVGSLCENSWTNSSNRYHIPSSADTGTYTWNVTMETSNGDTQTNTSNTIQIHNIPSTFSKTTTKTRLYKPDWSYYNFTFSNLWSENITDVSIEINCPDVSGFSCESIDSGLEIYQIGDMENNSEMTLSFNISANSSVPSIDYVVNITLNYTNPAGNKKSWQEYQSKTFEVRNLGILEINPDVYPENVTRNYGYEFKSYVNNTGGTQASDVWFNYTLPSGWSNSSGGLDKYQATLASLGIMWNNITVSVSESSALGTQQVTFDSSASDGRVDWTSIDIDVYANTTLDLETQNWANTGDNVTLNATLRYDNGSIISGQRVHFYDQTSDLYIGNDTTDNNGIASVIYWIPGSAAVIPHTLNSTFSGDLSEYINPSHTTTGINVHQAPQISSVSASPEETGFGYNVTISADVDDSDTIDKVYARVVLPNETLVQTEMIPTGPTNYEFVFSETWQHGQYNYSIYANDTGYGGTTSSESSVNFFNITVSSDISLLTTNTTYNKNEYVNITSNLDTWWNYSWINRFEINLTNTYKDLTDYQIKVEKNLSAQYENNEVTNDCSEVRFTYYNASAESEQSLDYFVEECNLSNEDNATMWVKVPYIQNDTTTTIYMYYDNTTSAESESNGTATFLFFDDFEGNELDSGKWDGTTYASTSDYDVDDGHLSMFDNWGGCCQGGCIYGRINTLENFTVPFAVESRFMVTGDNDLSSASEICYHTIFDDSNLIGISNLQYGFVFNTTNAEFASYNVNFPSKDVWYRSTLTYTENNLTGTTSYSTQTYGVGGTVSSEGPIGLAGDTDTATGYDYVDWIFVRNYTENEPSVTYNIQKLPSTLDNKGNTNFTGYIIMKVQHFSGGVWSDVATVINDSLSGELREINTTGLDLSEVWNPTSWYTGTSDSGDYRIYFELLDPDGNILEDSTGPMNSTSRVFEIAQQPIVLNLSSISIYDVTEADEVNWKTYINDFVDSGLNNTFNLYEDHIYRVEVKIDNIGQSNWNINSTNITHSNLDSSWGVKDITDDIWYSNMTFPDDPRTDTNFEGGLWNGNVTWNTTDLDGIVQSNENATFYYIVNVTSTGDYGVELLIDHQTFQEIDSSTFHVISEDTQPPTLFNDIYGLTSGEILRGESTKVYARWTETITRTNVNYTTTSNTTWVGEVNSSPQNPNNWTNFTLTSFSNWYLGEHFVKIEARDESGNWNLTLPNLVFNLTGLAYVNSIDINDTTPQLGDNITITCDVIDDTVDTTVSGYNVSFYFDDTFIGSELTTTDASISYKVNTPGSKTVKCNISDEGWYEIDARNSKQDTIFTTESIPPAWQNMANIGTAHIGDTLGLNTYWTDNFELDRVYLSVNITGSWTNDSNQYPAGNESWANFSYQIPTDTTPRVMEWRQWANDTSGNANHTQISKIDIWGWSEITNADVSPGSMQEGQTTTAKCQVIEANYSQAISGYNVTFWLKNSTGNYQYIASNLTSSGGWANISFVVDNAESYTVKCNISDDSTMWYNASAQYSDTDTLNVVSGADATPPAIVGNSYQINDTLLYFGQCLQISGQWNEEINRSWIEYDPSVGNHIERNISLPYTLNWTNISICTNQTWETGNHSVKLFAKDNAGNTNESLEYKYFSLYSRPKVYWHSPPANTEFNRSVVELYCNVTDKDTHRGVSGYLVKFYDDDGQLIANSYTNSSGVANVSYDAQTRDVGTATFSCKIAPDGYYEAGGADRESLRQFVFYGRLNATIDNPVQNQILHRGEQAEFEATIFDENSQTVSGSSVSWYNSTLDQIATGQTTTWTIPSDYGLGDELLTVNATKTYYHHDQSNVSVSVYGWSDINLESPGPGSYAENQLVNISCLVQDANTTSSISSYPVEFFDDSSSLGTVSTDPSGYANLSVNTNTLDEGSHVLRCRIDHNSSLYYNTSVTEGNVTITVDKSAPGIYYNPNTLDNGTYSQTHVFVNVTVDDNNTDKVVLYWNGAPEEISEQAEDTYWINKTSLADATYTFYVYANDTAAAYNQTPTRKVVIDTTSPVLTIESPLNTWYSGSSIDFNVSADENLSSCWFSLDNLPNASMSEVNKTFYTNTSTVTQGNHNITFYCNDTVDNIGNSSVEFSVDTQEPAIVLNTPEENNITDDPTIMFNCTAHDNLGIVNVSLYGDFSGTFQRIQTNYSGLNNTAYHFQSTLENGTFNWACEACDEVNCNITDNRTITVDTVYPELQVDNPENNTAYNYQDIDLNYTAVDDNRDKCWYNNGTGNNELAGCANITLNSYPEGNHQFTVYVNDTLDHTSSQDVSFTVDITEPEVDIQLPTEGQKIEDTNDVKLNFTAVDNLNRDKCWYSVDFQQNQTISNCQNTTITGLSNNYHNLTVYANDTAGNTNWTTVSFLMNYTVLSVTPVSPENNSHHNVDWVWANATTNKPAAACNYSVDNGANQTMQNTTDLYWSKNVSGLSESNHNLTFYCFDSLGNVTQSSYVFFTIDLTPPYLELDSPGARYYNTTSVDLNYSALDLNTITCSYSRDGGSYNTLTDCNNDTITGLSQGYHNITLRVVDQAGNVNQSFVEFNIDSITPGLTAVSPEQRNYTTQNIEFNVSINEPVNDCWYTLDGGPDQSMSEANSTYYYADDTLTDNVYNITYYCNDSANNLGKVSVEFEVDTTGPVITYEDPTPNNGQAIDNNYTYINISTNEDADTALIEWHNSSGVFNISMNKVGERLFWYNMTGLEDGSYDYRIHVNDTHSNPTHGTLRTLIVSTVAPVINIHDPLAVIYNSTVLNLNVTSNKAIEDWWFVLNGENFSFTPNITFAADLGENELRVFGRDEGGKVGNNSVTFDTNTTVWTDTFGSYTGLNDSENLQVGSNASIDFCWPIFQEQSLPQEQRETCWHYRKQLNISTSTTLEQYQYRFNLNLTSEKSAGKLDSNCSDIRFTFKNGSQEHEIPYWVEECESGNASIYVKIPVINSSTSLYMYYGNSYASSAANATDTFEFYDDFDTITQSDWGTNAQNWDTQDSIAFPESGGSGSQITSTYSFTNSYATELRIKANASAAGVKYYTFGNAGLSKKLSLYFEPSTTQINLYNGSSNRYSTECTDFKTYSIVSDFTNDAYEVYVDHNSTPGINLTKASLGSMGSPRFYSFSASGILIDWIAVRKFSSLHPTLDEIGSEETPTVNATIESLYLQPDPFWLWDEMRAELSSPSGTDSLFRILDQNSNSLCGNLSYAQVSSGYTICENARWRPKISLYAELQTDATQKTPSLLSWNVSWRETANTTFRVINATGDQLSTAFVQLYDGASLVGSGYGSISADIYLDRNYTLKSRTPAPTDYLKSQFSKLNLDSNYTIEQTVVSNYTGGMPDNVSVVSPVFAFNSTNVTFDQAKLTIPKNGITVDYIVHCTDWDFGSSECNTWEVDQTGDYTGYGSNSTHFWFNVTEFDAYAGGQEDQTQADLKILNITFSDDSPNENRNITIYVNVTNIGESQANDFVVQLNISRWDGSWNLNKTLNSSEYDLPADETVLIDFAKVMDVGTTQFKAYADWDNSVSESNESNNEFSKNLSVSAWHIFYGSFNYSKVLRNINNNSFITWDVVNKSNMFYYDYDASITPSDLLPLNNTNDLSEADSALGMTGFNDSIEILFDPNEDGFSDKFRDITISGTTVENVPIISTTTSGAFITGLLYDSADGGSQYNGSQDLVVITQVNMTQVGEYGTYDYEVKVPSRLKRLVGSINSVTRLDELE